MGGNARSAGQVHDREKTLEGLSVNEARPSGWTEHKSTHHEVRRGENIGLIRKSGERKNRPDHP